MRADGMYDEQISNAKYYQTSLFKGCVSRRALPPSLLYWRVRATYALYGNKVDSKTGKPLFNARAWKKANNVLKEIMLGYYSDPPQEPSHDIWRPAQRSRDVCLPPL